MGRKLLSSVVFQDVVALLLSSLLFSPCTAFMRCHGGSSLQYLTGDALTDPISCIGPNGQMYPHDEVSRLVRKESFHSSDSRRGKALFSSSVSPSTMDPRLTQKKLLEAYSEAREGGVLSRNKREDGAGCVVGGAPPRLCRSTYNTTAPMYGVSLTSGQPVTIVQKFPDLLQQVIYETCDSTECDVLHGECIQTYVPYLFLVIPLGPVTLTGQDYVLVESGCTCRPKYATPGTDPNPQDIIPNFS